ncbi:MAG: serine hydrolase domain-containing protein [Candidatus Aminicenantales bacterium]
MNFSVRLPLAIFLALLLVGGCGPRSSQTSKPEEVGVSGKHLRLLDSMIDEAIARKDFPGAVILIGRKGKTVFRKAYGECQWVPERRPMDETMIFDLASITKPVATATSFLILVEDGRISLDEKVKDYVPGFAPYIDPSGKPGEDARIWHLLTHTSGLPPYADAAAVEAELGRPCTTAQLVRYIAGLARTDPPGTAFHYSCLGYITLAHILKTVSGQDIAAFSEERIFKPLKMKHTFFTPPEKFRSICVPTEVVDKKPLSGIVHDPLARLQGGVSGNAGLFSTADDLAIFAGMLLAKGTYKGVRILSPLAVERMTTVWNKAPFAGRGLGWDLDSAYSTNRGDLFGPHSYGHTGYTGTSIWIDPNTETHIIFLTNRVHPEDKGAIIALRSRVANVVAASLQEPNARSVRR